MADRSAEARPLLQQVKTWSGTLLPERSVPVGKIASREEERTAGAGPATSGQSQGGEPQTKQVGIDINPGIYTSVLVASLGGVSYEITSERKGKMHALWLFLCCIPLFLAQVTTIFLLRTDMDLALPIFLEKGMHHATEGEPAVTSHEVARSQQLLHLKILMVVILYLMNFHMLLNTVRLVLLVLNPLTWVEIADQRACFTKDGWLGTLGNFFQRAGTQAPLALFALALQFIVGYVVCTDSVSLILDSDSVTDVIFNSLAITFIIDLSEVWWKFCKDALHMSWDDEFKLEAHQSVWKQDGQLADGVAEKTCVPCFTAGLVWFSTFKRFGRTSLFRRSFVQTRLETMATFVILAGLYTRQFYVVLFAIQTNVLPASRDICTHWRMSHGHAIFRNILLQLQQCLFVDVGMELEELASVDLAGRCNDDKYGMMGLRDAAQLTHHYPKVSVIFYVALITVLLAPQLAYVIISYVCERPKTPVEEEQPDVEALKDRIEDLEEKVDDLTETKQQNCTIC